jgi:hypothetical protein
MLWCFQSVGVLGRSFKEPHAGMTDSEALLGMKELDWNFSNDTVRNFRAGTYILHS